MTLSLCMIVKDEEKLLPHCLASVRDLADEIIVVDTGSDDRTIAVAKTLGAKVFSFTWNNDFAAARNESLKYASGDWILVLDADETLVPEAVPFIRAAIANQAALAITLRRQEAGTNLPPSTLSRLFRNRSDIRFFRPYHELIDDSVVTILQREPEWKVIELPEVAILHTGYQTGTIAQRRKVDRACSIMEGYLNTHPDDAYICSKLGALYVEMGKWQKGLDLLQRGLRSSPTEPAVLYELHYHLASTYHQLQKPLEAENHYKQAAAQPLSECMKLGAYNNLGDLLQERGDLSQAQQLFQTVVNIDPTFAIGHFNLGLTLKTMGNLADAAVHYRQAIQLSPTYADAYQNLGVVLLKLGQIPDSLQAFQRAIDLHEAKGSPEAGRLRQALRSMGLGG